MKRRIFLAFLALAPLLAARARVVIDGRMNLTEIPSPTALRALELGRGFFGGDANRFACRGLTSWNRAHGGGWLLWFQDTATGTQRCVRVTADETVSEPSERGCYRIEKWPAQDAAAAIARVLDTQHGVPTRLSILCPGEDDPARWYVVMLDGKTVTSLRIEPDGRVEPADRCLKLRMPPCRYEIGSADDGGTLSGIARLFYGDATRYNEIFEANRDVLKSPDVVRKGMVLAIPAPAVELPGPQRAAADPSARALARYRAFLDHPSERALLDLLVAAFDVETPSDAYRAFLLEQFAGAEPARFRVGLADADEIDAWTVAYACAERFLRLPPGTSPTRVVAICSRTKGDELYRFHLLRIAPAQIPAIRAALDSSAAVSRRRIPPIRDKTHGADALHYYEGGAPWARVEDMTLFFSERRITIDCYRNGDDYRKKQNAIKRRDHVCTEAEWRDIVGWLGAARFNEWNEVYAPGAYDGTVWRIEFLSGTNIVCRFMGVNNWPKRFYEFRKVKDFAMKLPEETHAEGVEANPHAEFAEAAEEPSPVPDPATIARYERFSRKDGDGETHAIPKAEGDEILAALKGWDSFEELRPKPRKPGEPCLKPMVRDPDLILSCILPDSPAVPFQFYRKTDAQTGERGLCASSPTVYSRQRRIPGDSARALLEKFDAWTAADRAAFLAVPLPRTYAFGTTSWDGGTLSGVAKLFYGDGNKWRVIWEANKAVVPNPDYVRSGTPLVIPALP